MTHQCFLEYKSAGESSESIIKKTVINSCMIKEFILTDECKLYISENTTEGNSQAIEPVVITDDSDDERETLPKWLTINATILYQSDRYTTGRGMVTAYSITNTYETSAYRLLAGFAHRWDNSVNV